MVKSSTTNLTVSLGGANTNALRDIKPPVPIASGWEWAWWVGLAILLAAIAYCAWRYWKNRQNRLPPVVVIPAHIRARRKLEKALALLGQPKEFCIMVSDTIRWYLEERFEFRAPERTTEEFLHELGGTPLLEANQKLSLQGFLEKCDLVKFAKYEPGEPELRELHASALRLVEETVPAPPPEAAATGVEGKAESTSAGKVSAA